MTVLTFPSAGGVKSDKVPLVNDVDSQQQQSTKSFSPKSLESGGPKNVDRNLRSIVFKVVLGVIVVLVAFWFSLFLYKNLMCAECKHDYDGSSVNSVIVASADSLNLQPDDDDRSNSDGDDIEDDDDVPCKTYHSYAAAKNDMVLPVTTSSPASADGLTITLSETADYDASQPNDMEDVYKKLEKFALSQALNRKDAQRRVNDDDVVTVFNENVEVDPTSSNIAQPAIITKSARFIHDFSVNITGIVDVEGQRCFVMPLMRNTVSPPASLYDLLFKMSSGYYSMDIKKAIGNMRVTKPALKNLNDYGLYISKDCADYSTFLLEKVDGAVNDV